MDSFGHRRRDGTGQPADAIEEAEALRDASRVESDVRLLTNPQSSRLVTESRMDEIVVRRVKILWTVAWLWVTGFVFIGWGFQAAAAAALVFVGVSFLAFVAFILNLLLGDEHVALRILLIVLFLIGLSVEVYGIATYSGNRYGRRIGILDGTASRITLSSDRLATNGLRRGVVAGTNGVAGNRPVTGRRLPAGGQSDPSVTASSSDRTAYRCRSPSGNNSEQRRPR